MRISEQIRRHEKKHKQRKLWKKILFVMSCCVVFCTTYALILPAITKTNTPKCGKEEHTHGEDCYALSSEKASENSISISSDEQKHLICTQEETEGHTHSREAGCYTETTALVCELEENEEHTHAPECYQTTEELTCTQEESAGHHHTGACYEAAEDSGAAANQEKKLICSLEEHTHSLACFADLEADIETAADWEQTLAGIALTGERARDVLAIAESQLDYQESEDNYIVAEDGIRKMGYTRYGAWYGLPYEEWCAMFVSFCLHYAGIPAEAFPQEASCPRWVEALQNNDLYITAAEGYLPKAGDLIFFDYEGDGQADHVGLVQEVQYGEPAEANAPPQLLSLTTIEGNCDSKVVQMEYSADDEQILGFGALSALDEVQTLAESGSWGYHSDGSIWWGAKAELEQATEIQENTPYIIAGYQGNNLMGEEAYEKEGYQYLKAIPKETVEDYQLYERWYFEKQTDGYYIYFQKTETDKLYLQFAGNGVTEWNQSTQQLTLTGDQSQATVFTVNKCGAPSYPNHVLVSAHIDDTTYYVNSYFGDKEPAKTTHWLGYPEGSEGSYLKLCQYVEHEGHTANRVPTETSTNSVINLFDYWLTPNRTDPDDGGVANTPLLNTGINKDHTFKFTKDNNDDYINLNLWTGERELPLQGAVANSLQDGYPALSGNNAVIETTATDSLAYLFNPRVECEGKASYSNVGGLLTIDEQGYYAFDCKKTMAEFDEEDNEIRLYDKPGVNGQFFPFNQAPQIMEAKRDDRILNHYFGMTLTTRFIQQHDGYTDNRRSTPTSFQFSGDDDVWIFIDDVLVGDVGGIHDACSVNIDFSTGKVKVWVAAQPNGAVKETTLYECYQAAGKEAEAKWNDANTTFANGSTHTLKFFYLERGNYDSNLELKYNLTEIPDTGIYKVDQYGEVVPGATFAVYAANDNYEMKSDLDGAVVNISDPQYDEAGNIVDGAGNPLVRALYTGTTNAQGEMLFADPDGMPYTLNELRKLFGDRFILREIKVPEGYRVVSKDVHLEIWEGENQTILRCQNTKDSGSRAASTLQVTATDILHLRRAYEGTGEYSGKKTIQYCDTDTGKAFGTLFAVVTKYAGPVKEDGTADRTELNKDENWVPVYGNEKSGYKMVDMVGESGTKSLVEAGLEAAKKGQSYGDITFTLSSSSTMQVTLENLPGHITQYYRMLSEDEKEQAKYTVAYYWTDQDSLDTATPGNTYGVYTFSTDPVETRPYSGFERTFGANIQVPNLINKILVQKIDVNDNRIDGATFALYSVQQDQTTQEIRYLATDGGYVSLTDQAVIAEDGVITDGDKTIQPVKTGVTSTLEDGIHTGTAEFSNMADGEYMIKEVKAPPGYKLNPTDVMVLVTEDTIYANAGTEDDGVLVGRGPGYVVSTLDKFASLGQLDNTLSWIYAQMRISNVSTSFADVGDESKISGYLVENNSGKTSPEETSAARSYLVYESQEGEAAFNYVPNLVRTAEGDWNGAQNPTGTRRLFTTVGWPYYEIYQDYLYGNSVRPDTADYEDWSGENLMNLFSRSTYIRVTDMQETNLAIKKVDATNTAVTLEGAEFRLYRQIDGKPVEYYMRNEKGNAGWTEDVKKALTVKTGAEGLGLERFTGIPDGSYYLEEIQSPTGYYLLSEPIKLTISPGRVDLLGTGKVEGNAVSEGVLDESTNLYTYTITVSNSSGFLMPATGGPGIHWYVTAGILLIFISTISIYFTKRKGEQR